MQGSFARRGYQPGDEPIPGYHLTKPLGRGGMGEVWKARSAGGIEVALKIIDGVDRVAGRKEFRGLQVVKNVKHPNLCPIIGFWLKDADGNILEDSKRLTAELVHGHDPQPDAGIPGHLRETMSREERDTDKEEDLIALGNDVRGTLMPDSLREGPATQPAQLLIAMGLGEATLADELEKRQRQGQPGLSARELVDCLEGCAKAIDLLNVNYNIQHCDIKPQNILLVGGAAQVCDFGLAKQMDDHRRTTTNAFTVAYAAPELINGREPTQWTDQYSLAISYVELRTGKLPYPSETLPAVVKAKETGNLVLAGLTKGERSVIKRAASTKPEDRYPNCMGMIRALQAAIQPQPRHLYIGRWIAALLLAAAVLGAAGYPIWPEKYKSAWLRLNQLFQPAKETVNGSPVSPGREDREHANHQFDEGNWEDALATLNDRLKEHADEKLSQELRAKLIGRLLRMAQDNLDSDSALAERQFRIVITEAERGGPGIEERLLHSARLGLARALIQRDPIPWPEVSPLVESLEPARDQFAAQEQATVISLALLSGTGGDARKLFEDAALDDLARLADLRRQSELEPTRALQLLEDLKDDALQRWQQGAVKVDDQRDPRLARIWPGGLKLALLLEQVDRQLKEEAPDFAAIRQVLAQAAEMAGEKPGVQTRLRSYAAEAALRDTSIPLADTLPAASKALEDSKSGDPNRLVPMLIDRLEREPEHGILRGDLVAQVEMIINSVRDRLAAAIAAQVDVRLRPLKLIAAIADAKPDYSKLADRCREVMDANHAGPWIKVLWAEARLQVDRNSWLEVDSVLRSVGDQADSPYAPYLTFVRALAEYPQPGKQHVESSATLLTQAFASSDRDPLFAAEPRRRSAVEILNRAAEQLRSSEGLGLEHVPYEQGDAGKAIGYLRLAGQMGLDLPASYQTNFALAAFYSDRRTELLPDILAACEIALEADDKATAENILLVQAIALSERDEPDDRPRAVQAFASGLERWWQRIKGRPQAGLPVFQRVVMPATETAGRLQNPAEELRPALASISGIRGLLVLRDMGVEQWLRSQGETPAIVAYSALTDANKYAQQPIPAYLVGQGRALIGRGDVKSEDKLQELQTLAATALERLAALNLREDVQAAGAFALQGYALILQSRQEPRQRERTTLLKRAVDSYQLPTTGANRDDPDYAEYLLGMSAAHLETAFFGCHDGQWWHIKQAVRFADAARNVPDRLHGEDAFQALGNAQEDEAHYLGEFPKYDDALASFETARQIAQRGGRSEATALFSLGRTRFRKVDNGASDDIDEDLQKALDNLNSARNQTESQAEKAEILMWLSRIHQFKAERLKQSDPDAAEPEFELAEKLGTTGVELAWDNHDLYWPRYQSQLAKLAWVRDRKEISLQLANRLLQVARDEAGGIRVKPQFVFSAVKAIFASESTGWKELVQVVDRHLPDLPADEPSGPAYRIELLLLRADTLANSTIHGERPPREIQDLAFQDVDQAFQLAGKLDCSYQRSDVLYRAHLILASLNFSRFMDDYYRKVNAENKAAAQALLEKAVTELDKAFDELSERLKHAREQLEADVGPNQLSPELLKDREAYDQRWRDKDISRTVGSRILFGQAVLVWTAFDVPPAQTQPLGNKASELLAEVQSRHVPATNAGRTLLERVNQTRERLK